MRFRHGKAYIRRLRPQDVTDSVITGFRIAFYEELHKSRNRRPPFVVVRHGFPGEVLEVGGSRADLKRRCGGRRFQEWCRWFKVNV